MFVGLRDGIGTDYFPIILSFERGYIDFNDIQAAFQGYMIVDLELLFKFFSTLVYYSNLDYSHIHIIVSGIEALLIYYLLKVGKNQTTLLVIVFTMTFFLNYPMNITRNGLALIFVIYAHNIKIKKQGVIYRILAMLSHYSSIPIILLTWIKIKKIRSVLIGSIFLIFVLYFFNELILKRYPLSESSAFSFKGYGIKLLLGTIFILLTNIYVIRRKIFCQENLILVALMIATYIFNPFNRYNMFYSYFIMYSNIFLLRGKKISPLATIILLLYPTLMLFSEWQEILRYRECIGCGNWIPYKNRIFSL